MECNIRLNRIKKNQFFMLKSNSLLELLNSSNMLKNSVKKNDWIRKKCVFII